MSEHRLIYADELYDTLANKLTWLMRHGVDVYLEAGEYIREAINDQPTAYDTDKVVERLEGEATLSDVDGIGKCYAIDLQTAVIIVKGGGAE